MWNEHFGIGIVEMMSAGLLVVAHNSGGPKTDIVKPYEGQSTGFLAATAEEYADAIHEALSLPADKAEAMRKRAHEQVAQFSDEMFESSCKVSLLQSGLLKI
jgi:alpha-1,2-mannosyltransferase